MNENIRRSYHLFETQQRNENLPVRDNNSNNDNDDDNDDVYDIHLLRDIFSIMF